MIPLDCPTPKIGGR